MSERVTVIIVTFNSEKVVGDCLRSFNEASKIIVVDNGSSDNTKKIVSEFQSVNLITTNKNLGYGSAANLGFSKASTEFAMLINPDIRFRQNTIGNLVQAADRYKDAGILAPKIWDNKKVQFGQRSFGRPLERVGKVGACLPQGDCCTVFLIGAALFFRLKKFNQIGGFDENIFLFYEDDDICLRMSQAGFSLIHVDSAHADHRCGESTEKSLELDWFRRWHTGWSKVYMQCKYNGTSSLGFVLPKVPLYALKAVGYMCLNNSKKFNQYHGELLGMLAYLGGVKAKDKCLPIIPPRSQKI
jgi:N-acetylglucosaminyl-diphospho-decaprenol L-rhamnosyltransferase